MDQYADDLAELVEEPFAVLLRSDDPVLRLQSRRTDWRVRREGGAIDSECEARGLPGRRARPRAGPIGEAQRRRPRLHPRLLRGASVRRSRVKYDTVSSARAIMPPAAFDGGSPAAA